MNRGLVVIICLLFFSLSILPTKAITRLTKASVDYPVHNLNTKFNYATIQEAINAPETQDRNTISVEAGTYYENVVINKSLSLMGENRETSTIDGARNGVTVSMEADNSSISGFRIQNSGSSDYDCGLSIFSSGNSLSNNSVTANRNGILINPGSDANILANNSVSANELYGIHLWYSDNDILNGNTVANCFDGVIIEFCRNLTLRNNVMSANLYNFGLGGWELPYFIHDIDKSNKVDGKTVQYMTNEENIAIDPTFDVGCLYLVNSTKVTIKDLTLNTPCWNGIQFAYTENSRIENVTVSETSYAIDFAHSFNNIVTSSSIMNRNGIRLSNSDNNTIVSNRISRNDQAILLFNSSDNTIVGNFFYPL
jgi:parallel beta-helix repeat protein